MASARTLTALINSTPLSFLLCGLLFTACSQAPASEEASPRRTGDLTEVNCEFDDDCDDGAFCNGTETCDAGYCRLGVEPRCDDGISCTEDSCSHLVNGCQFKAPDADGDGHADASCKSEQGEALGDDCDDEDAERFPGNQEICAPDQPEHDEDCDAKTFGVLDADLDGETSAICCNEAEDGSSSCGSDCDDTDYRIGSDYPEICDELDNDCDGRVDNDAKEVPWFPDTDGDHFGEIGGKEVLSCAPVEGHSLKPTDCDESRAAVHAAAREICDGLDNDCDGEIDEGGVCACTPDGHSRACACELGTSGVQTCEGGRWGSCDCSECVSGTKDCVGELLPRVCAEGRWQVLPSCRGIRPICLSGGCVCADGSDDCEEIPDVVPPVVVSSFPSGKGSVIAANSLLAVSFSEAILDSSVNSATFRLLDNGGNPVEGKLVVSGANISFEPSELLLAGQSYNLVISTELMDLAGNHLTTELPISFAVENACAEPPAQMLAWWKGEADATDSQGGNDGSFGGSAVAGVAGKVGKAFQFPVDGAYIDIPDHSSLNVGTGDFSVSFWIFSGTSSAVRVLLDKRTRDDGNYGWSAYLVAGVLSLQFGSDTFETFDTSLLLADSIWHHVVISVDRDQTDGLKVYLDGASSYTGDPTAQQASLSNSSPLRLGANTLTEASPLGGTLDEVMLFGKALTGEEANAIFNASEAGVCAN